MIVAQHVLCLSQTWYAQAINFLEIEVYDRQDWPLPASFAAIVAVYTIASSPKTLSAPFHILLKFFLLGLIMGIGLERSSTEPFDKETGLSVMTLIFEATLAGLWESSMLMLILLRTAEGYHLRRRMVLLSITIAGHSLLPRLLDVLGLPTHTRIKGRIDIPGFPNASLIAYGAMLMLHGVIYEILILLAPSTFRRVWVAITPDRYVTLRPSGSRGTREPHTRFPLTAIHYVVFGSLVVILPKPPPHWATDHLLDSITSPTLSANGTIPAAWA